MPPKERRATPRFQPKPGSHITYGATSAVIRDLSLEGVFVFDSDPLPVGSEIIFTLRAGDQDIALAGVVRRSEDQEGMAIQFTEVSPVSKRRLRIYIAGLVSAPGHLVKTSASPPHLENQE
jgi:PilZ domain